MTELAAQRRPRRAEAKPLAQATEWLDSYRRALEGSFQRLGALLDELKTSCCVVPTAPTWG